MYIPIQTPGGTIWAEIEEGQSTKGFKLTASHDKNAFKTFEEAADALKKNAQYLVNVVQDLSPQEVEVSFGIKVGVEAGTPLWGLAKATSEGSYTVTVKWKSGDGK